MDNVTDGEIPVFVPTGTVSLWNNLPREVVDSPTVATFKIQLHRFLGHLV